MVKVIAGKIFEDGRQQMYHPCPACNGVHTIWVGDGSKRPNWSFNGDKVDKPTFSPSINISWGWPDEGLERCHYFIREGKIQYCGDCTHDLAGKTVDLPDFSKDKEQWWVDNG